MSRHRNVHNLTADDYYDDYDEEEDEYYYQEQSRARKAKEANLKKKKAVVPKTNATPTTTQRKKQQPPTPSSASKKSTTGTSGKRASVVGSTTVPSSPNQSAVVASLGIVPASPTNSSARSSTIRISSGGGGVMIPPENFGGRPPNATTVTKNLPEIGGLQVDESKKVVASSTKRKISPALQERLKAQKSRLSMVILGHVDAGKSTLMGQLLVQMGIVQKRVVTKYEKEASDMGKASFALAWIMDEDTSERERGVTIDVATKHVSTTTHDLTILDAPGHADYVPAMIAGAASADVGLLVVAATPGEFESGFGGAGKGGGGAVVVGGGGLQVGQTREHIILSKSLGVSQLVVAVNKLDCADPPWSQTRFQEIKDRVLPFLLANDFKEQRVQFVPISGLTGINVKQRPSVIDGSIGDNGLAGWYDGPTLLGAINKFKPANRNIEKPLRFIITDMYPEGKGVTTRGRMVQGMVSVGDKVVVLPVGDEATVSRIEHNNSTSFASLPMNATSTGATYDNDDDNDDNDKSPTMKQQVHSSNAERLKISLAGDAVDLYLTGIDVARISPGNILSDVDAHLRPKIQKKIQANIIVMEPLSIPIITGMQMLFHMHSLDIPVIVSKIISKENKKDGSQIMKPRTLTGGAKAVVQLKLSAKVCVETFKECRALGRFALRRDGDTVAVGVVAQVLGQV